MIEKVVLNPSFLTLLGITVAVFTYLSIRYQEYKNILKSLLSQINSVRSWASANSEGWPNPPTEENNLMFVQPFYLIFLMENSVINQALLTPGIINFSDKFIEAVSDFNQQILRIHTIMQFRNSLVVANYPLCISIEKKLAEYKSHTCDILSLKEFLDSLTESEKCLANKLYNYSREIHTDLIGRRESGGLKTLFHIIDNEVKEISKKGLLFFLLKNWPTMILFLLSLSLIIFNIISIIK